VAIVANLAEVGLFVEASALFCLAVAEVHGIEVEQVARRRTLLLAVLLGDGGSKVVQKVAGRTGPYWAKTITSNVPMTTINSINRVLGPSFVTKYGTKQGVLVLGRDVPFGIGAAIGGGGNVLLGHTTIAGARRAFGPAQARSGESCTGPHALQIRVPSQGCRSPRTFGLSSIALAQSTSNAEVVRRILERDRAGGRHSLGGHSDDRQFAELDDEDD